MIQIMMLKKLQIQMIMGYQNKIKNKKLNKMTLNKIKIKKINKITLIYKIKIKKIKKYKMIKKINKIPMKKC